VVEVQGERRGYRSLSDDDIEAICLRLTQFSGLSPEEHRDHHNAFQAYIEGQRRKAEFWDKVKAQVGGWMIITAIGAIGTITWKVTWYAINTYLRGPQQ
jgi:hypothetical protein